MVKSHHPIIRLIKKFLFLINKKSFILNESYRTIIVPSLKVNSMYYKNTR